MRKEVYTKALSIFSLYLSLVLDLLMVTKVWWTQSLAPRITLTHSIYGCNGINRRVRGSPIKDLKLRRKGGKEEVEEARVFAYGPVIGLVSSYPFADVRKHLESPNLT
jgi:hypothetical protein